ncbi:MAG: triose-phosphate isomerase [Candidatus Kapabacteria bacterium]|nr:triose-phosphate isomerase [Candidatus Kapabacteria bacterium]MDW8012984.1 triose-phosphate isomerase [Bacteroidota bacterium]
MRWVVGNWKMHTTPSEAHCLALRLRGELANELERCPRVRVAVCPPFPNLEAVSRALQGSPVLWGAQNCHEEVEGAYTGEVSARMLAELGCQLVLVGHSERRRYACESDAQLARKLQRVVEFGMRPILCIGETLEERRSGQTAAVIERQLSGVLGRVPATMWTGLLVAYEPVWAIGTGVAATPEQIAEAHAVVRRSLLQQGLPSEVPILYGGSVHAGNAESILGIPEVAGVLVGTASLRAEEFCAIVRSAIRRAWC